MESQLTLPENYEENGFIIKDEKENDETKEIEDSMIWKLLNVKNITKKHSSYNTHK